MKKVQFTETVMRDANQSLMATRLPYADFEEILPVIASGTYCDIILPYCRMETRKEPLLVLWGLKKVYELNTKR